MKAIVFHGVGDIRLDDVREPKIVDPTDAIVRLTSSAICGTDLHFVRGTIPGMKPGTILGHEGVGVVEEVGKGVRNLVAGDRVVIPSTIGCGSCSYCRAGIFSQCDHANPGGPLAGSAFFGGPKESGSFHGLQAELARVPYANVGPVKLPAELDDDIAIMLSDILPTAYFAAELADIKPGRTVAVFGCGPVGQLAIACARLLGAGRVIAVDAVPSRLQMARQLGAEVIDFEREDPVQVIRDLTGGIGVDRAIDAVGVDANRAHRGPAGKKSREHAKDFDEELEAVAPKQKPDGDNWHPGDGPSQALLWALEALAKAGTLAIAGVYATESRFPIGVAMNKNITVRMGNCNHRAYIPRLLEHVLSGALTPEMIITQDEPILGALEAYKAFDRRAAGWMKVVLEPTVMDTDDGRDLSPGVQ